MQGLRAGGTRAGSYRAGYFPIIRIVNVPGIAAPRPARPPGGVGGAGPRSSAITKRRPVLLSNAFVRAKFIVSRFCSTSNDVGLFSLTMVIVPLPCELNTSIIAGLNAAPSEPPANGSVVRILPSVALRMTIRGVVSVGTPDLAHAA